MLVLPRGGARNALLSWGGSRPYPVEVPPSSSAGGGAGRCERSDGEDSAVPRSQLFDAEGTFFGRPRQGAAPIWGRFSPQSTLRRYHSYAKPGGANCSRGGSIDPLPCPGYNSYAKPGGESRFHG